MSSAPITVDSVSHRVCTHSFLPPALCIGSALLGECINQRGRYLQKRVLIIGTHGR